MVALQRQVLSQSPVPQFNEWSKLLRPIARDAAADGENSQFFLPQQSRREMLQILKRIEADLVPTRRLPQPVVQRRVEPEFRIAERRHEYRHALLIGRLQNS